MTHDRGDAAGADAAPSARCTHLLYLHGFRSSPQSTKARYVAAWLAAHRPDVLLHCPQLPPSPADALHGVFAHVAGWPPATSAVIGSSLGGYYATAVAERLGWRAVLLNPAVNPARDPAQFIDELRALACGALTRPERYFAVIAKGDEVLDWREMAARYAGCRLKLLEGGDHALSDFGAHWSEIARFLVLSDWRPA